jgi:hypothetical protein
MIHKRGDTYWYKFIGISGGVGFFKNILVLALRTCVVNLV